MRSIAHHRSGAVDRTRHPERGAVGGIEVLPFGFLIFVVGTLLLVNAWAVVDAKLTVDAAAREAGRSYVEAGSAAAAPGAAQRAAREVVAGAGRNPDRLVLSRDGGAYVRCAVVTHEVTYVVPSLTLPFVGGFGRGITVHGHHRDVIDPFASGLDGSGDCGG